MDFRARQIDPALLQQLVQARSQDRGTTNFQQGLGGLKEGINFAVQIGDIVEKRRKAQQLAQAIQEVRQKPEYQEANKESGGLVDIAIQSGEVAPALQYVRNSQTKKDNFVTITPDTNNIESLRQIFPGINLEVGIDALVPRQAYAQAQITGRKQGEMGFKEKMAEASQKGRESLELLKFNYKIKLKELTQNDTTMKELSNTFGNAYKGMKEAADDETKNSYVKIMNDSLAAMTNYLADKNPEIGEFVSETAIDQPEIFGIKVGKAKEKPVLTQKTGEGKRQGVEKPSKSGKVLVINAQGQKGYIPAEQLEQALKQGYKRAQ